MYITPYDLLEELRMYGVSDQKIIDYLVNDYFSHSVCLDAMKSAKEEFLNDYLNESDDLFEEE